MFESMAVFFAQGGAFMWLILAILACALAVIVERLVFYARASRANPEALVAAIARALNAGDLAAARALVARDKAPLSALLATALERHGDGLPAEAIRKAVEEAAIREIPRFGQRSGYLALCANISTLAGLLGTIFGLQQAFASLAAAEAAQKAAMLAAGISQALNTTAFGLIVAIPCMVAYSVFSSRQAKLIEDADAASVALLNYFEARSHAGGDTGNSDWGAIEGDGDPARTQVAANAAAHPTATAAARPAASPADGHAGRATHAQIQPRRQPQPQRS
jgi:biopolymer transport protein ExbB